ncbi:hypothetical protein SDJN03_13783, partial [Cucurbita argyrosperma subsp. sororia]
MSRLRWFEFSPDTDAGGGQLPQHTLHKQWIKFFPIGISFPVGLLIGPIGPLRPQTPLQISSFMAAITSTCSSFFSIRSSSMEPRVRTSSPTHASPACGKLDGVATWLINGFVTAFFGSLERCSCIRIATAEDDGDEANDAPLIPNDGNLQQDGTAAGRRRTVKGKKCQPLVDAI